MKSYNAIPLTLPLRDVRLTASGPADAAARQREAEQAAYERGHREGENALSEQLLQQRAELLELHQGVIDSLRTTVPQLVKETETALIELAMEAAKKIVANAPISREMVEAVVREALGQIEETAEITVQLHNDDLALLRKHKSPLLQGVSDTGPLRFASSTDVTRGGCIIHTRFGLLDARRETKLEQLRNSLAA